MRRTPRRAAAARTWLLARLGLGAPATPIQYFEKRGRVTGTGVDVGDEGLGHRVAAVFQPCLPPAEGSHAVAGDARQRGRPGNPRGARRRWCRELKHHTLIDRHVVHVLQI